MRETIPYIRWVSLGRVYLRTYILAWEMSAVIESVLLRTPTNSQSLWSNLVLQALVKGTLMKGDLGTSPF